MLRGDAGACIVHGNRYFSAFSLGSYRDLSALGRVRDGIVQQVAQHLSHAFGIHINGRQVCRQSDGQRQALDVRLGL